MRNWILVVVAIVIFGACNSSEAQIFFRNWGCAGGQCSLRATRMLANSTSAGQVFGDKVEAPEPPDESQLVVREESASTEPEEGKEVEQEGRTIQLKGKWVLHYGWFGRPYYVWEQWNYTETPLKEEAVDLNNSENPSLVLDELPACPDGDCSEESQEADNQEATDENLETTDDTPFVIIERGYDAGGIQQSADQEDVDLNDLNDLNDNIGYHETVERRGLFGTVKKEVTVKCNGSDYEVEVFNIINRYRVQSNLPALEWDNNLASGSRSHATWINSGGWGHAGGCMECIARINGSPQSLVNLWLNSPPHRAIIMSRTRFIGIGCVGGGHTLRVR